MSKRARIHREWFRPVTRKCQCGSKLPAWSWGEYIRGKWHNVQDICPVCWPSVIPRIVDHRDTCGCTFELVGKGATLPDWLVLPVCPVERTP